jgi:23S rRNA (guanosine2251-2'-O)-methyltransferase
MIVYGKQPILYLLESRRELIKEIFLAKQVERDIFQKMGGIRVSNLDSKKAQAMARGGNHQGFLAEVDDFELKSYRTLLEKSNFLLILHSITDIGNIGAIVRTAYSLGVDGVIVTGLNSLKLDGIARTSAGAMFDMPMAHYGNIYDIINEAKQLNFSLYGATMDGEDIREVNFPEKRILILGSESEGIPNRVLKSVDKKIKIEMERSFDSLNVSVASAILIDRMRS